jgi:spermidine synthase
MTGWTKTAAINRDINLRLQYLAGLGVNLRQGDVIYRNMIGFRRVPSGRFSGSDALKSALWQAIQTPSEQ